MKNLQLIFAFSFFAAAGSVQAESAIDTHGVEAAIVTAAATAVRVADAAPLKARSTDLAFVNQLFQDLYSRVPSAAELAANLNALQQPDATRAQVAASLFRSAEFHDNAGFLVKCYTALLQHAPDFLQWSQILKLMQSGVTQDSAMEAFLSAPEFTAAFPGSLSDGAFVTKLHRQLLGRNPDAAELDSFARVLAKGGSRPAMVEGFLRGAEFEMHIASRVNTSLAYLAFLRRNGDAAATDTWTDKLDSGAPVTDLIGDLISLPEYDARF